MNRTRQKGSRRRTAFGMGTALALVVTPFLLWRALQRPEPPPEARPDPPAAPAATGALADSDLLRPVVLAAASPRGHLRLVGQVVDAAGVPVAGATVSISTQPVRAVSSDVSGTFEIGALAGGRYRVVARYQNASAGPVPVVVTDPPSSVMLRLRASTTELRLTVISSEGSPIAGATVELRGVTTERATTDADGQASLWPEGPGVHTLAGAAPGYERIQRRLAIPPGVETLKLDLVLDPGAAVSGRVVTESGQPVPGARVWYERAGQPAWATGDPRVDGVDTDSGGSFTFPTVALGSYRFLAQHPEFALGHSSIVMVDGRRARADVLVVVRAGGVICGRVEETSGTAAPWARVRVSSARASGAADPVWETTASADGAFCADGLPRKPLVLVASSTSTSSVNVEVDLTERGRVENLVVRLVNTLSIAGIVESQDGEPIPDATVTAMPRPSDADISEIRSREPATDLTALDGRFTLRGLAAGVYALYAVRSGAQRTPGVYSQPSAVAEAGRQDVVIVLPGEGGIKGKVAWRDGGVPPLYSVGVGHEVAIPFAAPDGAFELAGLDAGRVTVVVSGPTFEPRIVPDVTVNAGSTSDLGTIEVEAGRSVEGLVVQADGTPVPGATVYSGKMLVGTGEALTTRNFGVPGAPGEPRSTITGEAGTYRLDGVGRQEFALVADHPVQGRSAVVKVPAGDTSVNVDIMLAATGSIEGLVRRGGTPVEGVTVDASPATVNNNSHFMVTTGPDGSFRFDRVSAASYFVTVMHGSSPLAGVGRFGRSVAVEGGKTAVIDIDLPPTTVTLLVTLRSTNGEPIEMAELHVVSGLLRATVSRELREYESNLGSGFTFFRILLGGQSARVSDVPAGEKLTACAIAYPADVAKLDTPEIMNFVAKEGNRLPTVCKAIDVTAENEQSFAVEAAVPPRKKG